MPLSFCPICGNRLPQSVAIRYCSSCGEELSKYKSGNDDPIADLQRQGLNEAEIRLQTADKFAKLKARLSAREGARAACAQPGDGGAAGDHLSVVLKTSDNKERLARQLSAVLRRGAMATRMAVDMVPCVIMYKSKIADVQAVLAILDEEHLHYSVLKGDFETILLEDMFPELHRLTKEVQLVLRKAPKALWLGEKIVLVVPDAQLGEDTGVLVVTDKALYFDSISGGLQGQWRIVPFSRLTGVVCHDNEGALELINREYSREELLRVEDEDYFRQVYEWIGPAIGR